jgi:hypothetical protein
MARESRTVLTIFVGSPGDVEEERKAVFEVVSELNELIAPKFGFLLEVKGWESVIRKSGRPQDQINPFVDKCDYFIGIMWKKWGMAPDTAGEYSSGFEEEFHRACNLKKAGEGPEISQFFRAISRDVLEYGNDSIPKVVNFRQSLIDGYEHVFQDYSDPAEFTKYVRKVLTEFLFNSHTPTTSGAGGGQVSNSVELGQVSGLPAVQDQREPTQPSAFDPLEIEFAKSILARIAEHPARRLDELLPWNWQPSTQNKTQAA